MTPLSAMTTLAGLSGRGAAATPRGADDAALIDRFLRTGDEDTFEILVRRYRDKVFGLAVSILGYGAESEAEDATQEVFVVVLRQLKTFRRESSFSTWLYRVARNQIAEHRRRFARHPSDAADGALPEIPDRGTLGDPQRAAETACRRSRLLRQIDRLSEPQRVAVYLHYWRGESIAEISELLGLSPNTVKSHLCRARRKLARALREEGTDD